MTVRLIFAQTSNGFIGRDGKLLFQIPEDMKRFKELTQGSTVIMGRVTWESIPEKYRPLPGRHNVVISTSLRAEDLPQGVELQRSLNKAVNDNAGKGPIWIIGGEALYQEGLLYADEIHETLIAQSMEGDRKAPEIKHHHWSRVQSSAWKDHEGLLYQFNTYLRKNHGNKANSGEEGSPETLGSIQARGEKVRDQTVHHPEDFRNIWTQGIDLQASSRPSGTTHLDVSDALALGFIPGSGQNDSARSAAAAAEPGLEAR